MSVSFVFPLLMIGFAVADPSPGKMHHGYAFDVCCKFEPLMAAPEKPEMKACVKEILGEPSEMKHNGPPTEEEMNKIVQNIACIQECTAKKFDMLDDAGNILLDKLVEVGKDDLKGTFMEDTFEETAKTCIEEIEKQITKEFKCNPKPLFLSNCLFFRTLENCPADQVKDKAKCDSLIEEIKTDNFTHGPPHP